MKKMFLFSLDKAGKAIMEVDYSCGSLSIVLALY